MGTWQHKFVTPTLPGSLSNIVVLSKLDNIVEYRNGEKQYKLLMACRKAGLGNLRSQ
jgi:hypothetical protein